MQDSAALLEKGTLWQILCSHCLSFLRKLPYYASCIQYESMYVSIHVFMSLFMYVRERGLHVGVLACLWQQM